MIQSYPIYKVYNIGTTSAGVQIVAGSGVLHSVCVNTPVAAQVVTISDGTTGAILAKITTPTTTSFPSMIYDVGYKTGLYIITTTGAANVTVGYL